MTAKVERTAGPGLLRRTATGPGWRIWRTPDDEPSWIRPALLILAAVAALAYGWGMAHQVIEVYYGASVRSMADSWHNFIFAAFDPDATVSIDKLPGGLWPQAVMVAIFGPHIWAMVAPQVVEGVLAILVLFTAVRRLAGPVAGLVAAAVLTATPVTVSLNRGNVPDALMILLVVCAVGALSKALTTGRAWHLATAGVWIGLAFQVKMLQAWLIVPALAVTWLLAGPGKFGGRFWRLLPAGLVLGVVSLAWMTAVSLVPAADRPVVDGSTHNSLFQQVFEYNAFGRVAEPPVTASNGTAQLVGATLDRSFWLHRSLTGRGGLDVGWLIPAALLVGIAVLIARRRQPRTDLLRAACVLWGTWLVIELVTFGVSDTVNTYYLASMGPAIAGLIGVGAAALLAGARHRSDDPAAASPAGNALPRAGVLAALGIAVVTVGYGCWLLAPAGAIRFVILAAALLACGLGAMALLAAKPAAARGVYLLAIAVLLAPALAAGSLIARGWGPFDTPYEPASISRLTELEPAAVQRAAGPAFTVLQASSGSARYPAATVSALIAAPLIFASGQEVLPIGGFTGTYPFPTLRQLKALIAQGQLHLVISATQADPRVAWIRAHCKTLPPVPTPAGASPIAALSTYYCGPAAAVP
jgi:4-amino-4-deoxy-L-arabinose transferase-like glycosyltransferase